MTVRTENRKTVLRVESVRQTQAGAVEDALPPVRGVCRFSLPLIKCCACADQLCAERCANTSGEERPPSGAAHTARVNASCAASAQKVARLRMRGPTRALDSVLVGRKFHVATTTLTTNTVT